MAFSVPTIGSPNSTQDPIVKSAVEGLNNWAGTYRTILHGRQGIDGRQGIETDKVAGTYIIGGRNGTANGTIVSPVASGGNITENPVPFFYFDDADYLVSSLTQKLRLRTQIACNATKAAIKFTFGLYPITVAGAADQLTMTLGTVVSGSTVEINEPAASTVSSGTGSDFTIPADGAYCLGVVTSGTLTNNSCVLLSAQLQTRST